MMAAAYSDDLRRRVMDNYDKGMKVSHVCRLFNISRYTFYEWKYRREATGTTQAASGYQRGHSHKIKDWDAFAVFVEEKGHLTLKDMAALWPEPIDDSTLSRGMKKLGCTHKKRLMVTKSVTKQLGRSIKRS